MEPGFDFIGVNVGFLCHDGHGNVLLHLRSDQCRDEHNTWDFGGGQVEFGEELEEAVLREVHEEYGCTALEIQHIAQMNLLREHNGKKSHWLANIYAVLIDPSKIKIMETEKNLENRWFTLDTLPSPLHSVGKRALNEFLPQIEQVICNI